MDASTAVASIFDQSQTCPFFDHTGTTGFPRRKHTGPSAVTRKLSRLVGADIDALDELQANESHVHDLGEGGRWTLETGPEEKRSHVGKMANKDK